MKTLTLALTVGLLLMIMAGAAFGGPNLTIPESAFDFGYVPQHSKVSHTFWLHSTGDSTLEITKIVPG